MRSILILKKRRRSRDMKGVASVARNVVIPSLLGSLGPRATLPLLLQTLGLSRRRPCNTAEARHVIEQAGVDTWFLKLPSGEWEEASAALILKQGVEFTPCRWCASGLHQKTGIWHGPPS